VTNSPGASPATYKKWDSLPSPQGRWSSGMILVRTSSSSTSACPLYGCTSANYIHRLRVHPNVRGPGFNPQVAPIFSLEWYWFHVFLALFYPHGAAVF
jgi:hypothetical protein